MIFGSKLDLNNDFVDIKGRKKTRLYRFYDVLCVLSFGILYILDKHYSLLKVFLTTKNCKLKDADSVILINKHGKIEFRQIKEFPLFKSRTLQKFIFNNKIRVIDTEYGRFMYNYALNKFILSTFNIHDKIEIKNAMTKKITMSTVEEEIDLYEKKIMFGKNNFDLKLPTNFNIIIDKTFNLTNFINLASVILWYNIEYKIYAVVVFIIMLYIYKENLISEIKKKNELLNFRYKNNVKVFRNQNFVDKDSSEIYPGDLILIDPIKEFFCDALIVKGDVITDESFLTGESVPICKSYLQHSIVFAGSSIIKSVGVTFLTNDQNLESLHRIINLLNSIPKTDTKNDTKDAGCQDSFTPVVSTSALGLVVATGFNTTKGKILKDVINPKPVVVKFLTIAYRIILFCVLLSLLMSIVQFFILKYLLNWSVSENLIYCFDMFFTLANPNLYDTLSIGIHISNRKLRENGIFCNDLNRIYLGGNIDISIFDKTGTLTLDGMDFTCLDNCKNLIDKIEDVDMTTKIGLATCHSVYELDGKYSGDALDLQMFLFTKSKLNILYNNNRIVTFDDSHNVLGPFLKEFDDDQEVLFYQKNPSVAVENNIMNYNSVKILKTKNFTSQNKMMSVIVEHRNKKYIFCKGSPDKIKSLLINTPENYDHKVNLHSCKGYRVISLAYKELESNYKEFKDDNSDISINKKIENEMYKNLNFLSLVVFSNKLKPESKSVIRELLDASICTKICTGDNLLTAISVGRECGIIDETLNVVFPVVEEHCKSIYDVEWICIGTEDFFFDKVKMAVCKNNSTNYQQDFIVACDGKAYDFLIKTNHRKFLLEKGAIFARFSPSQKKSLVEDYRLQKSVTLFCGDGANDSGAIGSADVGVALVQNEASIGSGFVANNLDKIPLLIKECRNAYVTSVSRFKFMVISNILIYSSLFILIGKNKFLTDFQTLHIDIFLVFPMSFYLSSFKKSQKITIEKPYNFIKLDLSFFSIFIEIFPQIFFNFLISMYEKSTTTFSKTSFVGTFLFFILSQQILFNGLLTANFFPYRETIWQNRWTYKIPLILIILQNLLFLISLFQFKLKFYTLSDLYEFKFCSEKNFEMCFIFVFNMVLCLLLVPFIRKKARKG